MDKQTILHKIRKYEEKIKLNGEKEIYKMKLKMYKDMVGGGDEFRNYIIELFTNFKFENNIYGYINLLNKINEVITYYDSNKEKVEYEYSDGTTVNIESVYSNFIQICKEFKNIYALNNMNKINTVFNNIKTIIESIIAGTFYKEIEPSIGQPAGLPNVSHLIRERSGFPRF